MSIIDTLEIKVSDYLNTGLRQRRSVGRLEGVHPSEVSDEQFCYRKDIFHQLNREHKLGFSYPPSTFGVFEAGHALHSWVREEWLGPMGILKGIWVNGDKEIHGFFPGVAGEYNRSPWRYEELAIEIEDLGLVGHIDGIIDLDGEEVVIDIKSIQESGFNAVKKPNQKYVHQLHLYMHALNIKKAVVYYVDKTTYARKGMLVEYDPEIFDMLKNRIEKILEHRKDNSNELPDCHEKCTPKSKLRKECMFSDVCRQVSKRTHFINKEYVLSLEEDIDEVEVWGGY